jgi:ELWxxDGT repeat protein
MLFAQSFEKIKVFDDHDSTFPVRDHYAYNETYKNRLFYSVDDGIHGMELWASNEGNTGAALLKDINCGVGHSIPRSLTKCNGYLFFTVTTERQKLNYTIRELWRTDGSDTGTIKLLEYLPHHGLVDNIIITQDSLITICSREANSSTIWQTDGTISNTQELFKTPSGYIVLLDFHNGSLLYGIRDSTGQVWKRSKTKSTLLLNDSNLIVNSFTLNFTGNLNDTNTNYSIFSFRTIIGTSLYSIDNNMDTVRLLNDFKSRQPYLDQLEVIGTFNNYFLLSYKRSLDPNEIWTTDGTIANTNKIREYTDPIMTHLRKDTFYLQTLDSLLRWDTLAKKFIPTIEIPSYGSTGHSLNRTALVHDTFYFLVNDSQLLSTDGSMNFYNIKNIETNISGTLKSTNIISTKPNLCLSGLFYPVSGPTISANVMRNPVSGKFTFYSKGKKPKGQSTINTTIYSTDSISFYRPRGYYHGYEWVRSDGTTAGTYNLEEQVLYSNYSTGIFSTIDSNLYVGIRNISSGSSGSTPSTNDLTDKIWQSDGTTLGTTFFDSSAMDDINMSISYKGSLYFFSRQAFWKLDSNRINFISSTYPPSLSYLPRSFTIFNDLIYYTDRKYLVRSDGTPSGTVRVDSFAGLLPYHLIDGDSVLYLTVHSNNKVSPYKTDGKIGGKTYLDVSNPTSWSWFPKTSIPFDTKRFFIGSEVAHGSELWVTDSSHIGSHLLVDLNPGSESSKIESFTVSDRVFYFFTTFDNATKLWKSDGTVAGTQTLHSFYDLKVDDISFYSEPVVNKGNLYFTVYNQNGLELWISDGTFSGTRPIISPNQMTPNAYARRICSTSGGGDLYSPYSYTLCGGQSLSLRVLNGIVYFSARTKDHGTELWKIGCDGEIPELVQDFIPGCLDGGPLELEVDSKGRLFALTNDAEGLALWVSDAPVSNEYCSNDTFCYFYVSESGDTIRNDTSIVESYVNIYGADSIISTNIVINGTTPEKVYVETCGQYISPSGIIITSDTTFTDTLNIGKSCDSLIRFTIRIRPISQDTIVLNLCDSFEHTNNTIYYNSTFINDTFINRFGCDSIVITQANIHKSETIHFNINACENYIGPDGSIFQYSGEYYFKLQTKNGCDSIVTISLNVLNHTSNSMRIDACDSFVNKKGLTYFESQTYNDTIANSVGCDSVITVLLNINKSKTGYSKIASCEEYIDKRGTIWTSNGFYFDTLTSKSRCDSIVKISIIILNKSYSKNNVTSCLNYISPSGKSYHQNGIYTDTITNSEGCDSIITTNLSIDTVDTKVSLEQRTLTATATNGIEWYKWTPCNRENIDLPNSNTRYFTSESAGWYSLLIKQNNCVDTSKCFYIGSTDLSQNINIGPNPTFDQVFVSLGYNFESISYVLYNALGEKIDEKNYTATNAFKIDMSHYASGIYSLKVFDGKDEVTTKIVKINP